MIAKITVRRPRCQSRAAVQFVIRYWNGSLLSYCTYGILYDIAIVLLLPALRQKKIISTTKVIINAAIIHIVTGVSEKRALIAKTSDCVYVCVYIEAATCVKKAVLSSWKKKNLIMRVCCCQSSLLRVWDYGKLAISDCPLAGEYHWRSRFEGGE